MAKHEHKQLIKTIKCTFNAKENAKNKSKKDKIMMVYRDLDTNEKFHETIEDPQITYYLTKEDRLLDTPVSYIPEEDVDEFECGSQEVVKSVHYNLGLEDEFWDNINNKRFDRNRAIMLNPNVHGADMDIEDFYIGNYYENNKESGGYLTKAFFDIEVDSINSIGFPKPEFAVCPINAISLFSDEKMTLYELLLDQPENQEQITKFKNNMPNFKKRIIKKYKDKYDIDIKVKIIFVENEIEYIQSFFELVHLLQPDFLGAWNLTNFDANYIYNRLLTLGVEGGDEYTMPDLYPNGKSDLNDIICDPRLKYHYAKLKLDEKNQDPADKGSWFYCADYTNWVDMLLLFANLRKTAGKRDSYALDDIAQEEIGAEKLHFKDPDTTIKNSCYKDYEEFVEYNMHDSVLLYLIERKNKDFDMLYTVAAKTQTRMSCALKKTICIKNLARKFYRENGLIMSDNHNTKYGEINRKTKKEFRGAFVGDPNLIANVGIQLGNILSKYIFDNVIDFDLSSLYPSLILAFNIDATTQIGIIDIMEYYLEYISTYDSGDYTWDTIIAYANDELTDEEKEKLTDEDVDKLDKYCEILKEENENILNYQSKLADDIVTNDFIDNAKNYFGLPNITDALKELSVNN